MIRAPAMLTLLKYAFARRKLPRGLEANWIETVGKGFYPMFRFYTPKAGLFEGTWKLPDVEVDEVTND